MKILITGDAGFVGREFKRSLSGHEIVRVDIKNGIDARTFFQTDDRSFDLVIHLAAVVGGRLTIEGSPLSVAVDLAIDAEMFQWAIRTKPKRIVYFSSSAAYPVSLQKEGSTHLLKESDIDLSDVRSPDFSYGWAKLTGEVLAQYARESGLVVHVFRPFSGYGTDQDLDYPFPSFIARGLRKDNPFEVWGSGDQVRDFIHIKDVVGAVLSVFESDESLTLNLGTGIGTSFNELANLVMKEARYSGRIRHSGDKPVGCYYRVADVTLMKNFYEPKISLGEGIRMALNGDI
jgi:nucleoside-diphosphate-sugar epimerase